MLKSEQEVLLALLALQAERRKHVIQQIRLYCSGPTLRVRILHGGPGGGMCPVVSAGKEKNIFFKSRRKNLLFNFESFLTLKGPGFSDFWYGQDQ